jgi:hypothetical protein
VIGKNWLLRAQKPLASIQRIEGDSSSSGASLPLAHSNDHDQPRVSRATVFAEERLHTAEYVEARGILLPATEYLQRAVDAAQAQNKANGEHLSTVRNNDTQRFHC